MKEADKQRLRKSRPGKKRSNLPLWSFSGSSSPFPYLACLTIPWCAPPRLIFAHHVTRSNLRWWRGAPPRMSTTLPGLLSIVWTATCPLPRIPSNFSFPSPTMALRTWPFISLVVNMTGKRHAITLMPLLKTPSARNAIAICCTCQINAVPCWPTAPYFMPNRDMRKNVSIVIMIWYILNAVW